MKMSAVRSIAGLCAVGTIAFAAPAFAADPTAAEREEAKTVFAQRCTVCHGPTGAGDGPTAAALNPKPRAFADPAFQAAAKDADIEKVIADGGPSIGKSPLMPPNPDLKAKPGVVAALREIVRNFKKK